MSLFVCQISLKSIQKFRSDCETNKKTDFQTIFFLFNLKDKILIKIKNVRLQFDRHLLTNFYLYKQYKYKFINKNGHFVIINET